MMLIIWPLNQYSQTIISNLLLMSITEKDIDNWDNKVVSHKKNVYPQSCDINAPKLFFVSLFIGSRGSGKTFAMVKLLKQYEKYKVISHECSKSTSRSARSASLDGKSILDQRIILFSPTIDANPIFKSLKHLNEDDIITDYNDDKLSKILEDIKYEKEETDKYLEDLKLYNKFIKHSHLEANKLLKIFTQDELQKLELMNYDKPKEPKYPQGVVNFMIFDDLIASSAFKSQGKSIVTNLCLKNRHLSINILIASQSLKSVTKSIRNNTSLFVIYKFANKKIILEDIYEEISSKLKPEEFLKLYEFATDNDHNALVIDLTGNDKLLTFRKNFDKSLQLL